MKSTHASVRSHTQAKRVILAATVAVASMGCVALTCDPAHARKSDNTISFDKHWSGELASYQDESFEKDKGGTSAYAQLTYDKQGYAIAEFAPLSDKFMVKVFDSDKTSEPVHYRLETVKTNESTTDRGLLASGKLSEGKCLDWGFKNNSSRCENEDVKSNIPDGTRVKITLIVKTKKGFARLSAMANA